MYDVWFSHDAFLQSKAGDVNPQVLVLRVFIYISLQYMRLRIYMFVSKCIFVTRSFVSLWASACRPHASGERM